VPVRSFEETEGREAWYTPWGAPADVRSISAGADGAAYVNVHVGGVLRSGDRTWRPTLDIEHDVHQVLVPPGHPGLLLVAAADGFGRSGDGGDTWQWDNDGLHAHYCRAVAVAGGTVLISASSGHHGRRATVYRRPLDGSAPFERCRIGLPEWFSDNVDTGCLVARGRTVVIGTEDGSVFLSEDGGERASHFKMQPLARTLAARARSQCYVSQCRKFQIAARNLTGCGLHGRRIAFRETTLVPIWIGLGRRARSVELFDLIRRQIPANGAEVILELLLVARANDDARNGRAMKQPIQSDLRDRFPRFFRDAVESIDDAE